MGQALTDAFLGADGPLCFEDLLDVAPPGAVAEVSAWVGHALEARFIEEEAGDGGVRCFRLRSRGLRALGSEKRRRTATR